MLNVDLHLGFRQTESLFRISCRGAKTVLVLPNGSRVVAQRDASIDYTMIKFVARGFP
jgi:hypothetical protein